MSSHARNISREIGMALAVLAIWLVSLLAPMHQVSRLIGDLAQAGVVTVADWSLCVPLGPDDDGQDGPQTLCPAKGIGKSDGAVMLVAAALAMVLPLPVRLYLPAPPDRFWARVQADTGQPRAPPVPV